MPGIVHYDFGDAIRPVTQPERKPNLDEVHFNMDYFEAFTAGFMEKPNTFHAQRKRPRAAMHTDDLPASCPFLDGLFDGDHYYPITYPSITCNGLKFK